MWFSVPTSVPLGNARFAAADALAPRVRSMNISISLWRLAGSADVLFRARIVLLSFGNDTVRVPRRLGDHEDDLDRDAHGDHHLRVAGVESDRGQTTSPPTKTDLLSLSLVLFT